MRILYVTDALAVWGGVERVLCDKMNYMVDHYGFDVHIVTTNQGNHPIPFPLDKRIHLCDLGIMFHHQYKYHGLKRIWAYINLTYIFNNRLKSIIDDVKPDVIVCICVELIYTVFKVKQNIPMVYECHSICNALHYDEMSVWKKIKLKYLRHIIHKADCKRREGQTNITALDYFETGVIDPVLCDVFGDIYIRLTLFPLFERHIRF